MSESRWVVPEQGTELWNAAWAALGRHIKAKGWGPEDDYRQTHYGPDRMWDQNWMFDGGRYDERHVFHAAFRHRHHPVTRRKECVEVTLSPDDVRGAQPISCRCAECRRASLTVVR